MSYQVIVTRIADTEAMEAFRWYADRNPVAAARFSLSRWPYDPRLASDHRAVAA